MAKTFTYNKHEKLKSRKLLEALFKKGKSFTIFPIKVFYMRPENKTGQPVQTSVGVSKKNFRKAVDRNRIKRLMREVYRTGKNDMAAFLEANDKQVIIFLLYTNKILPDYEKIKKVMPAILERLTNELNEAVS